VKKIEEVNPLWVPVMNEFRDALTNFDLENFEKSTFNSICTVVQNGYPER
jgi:hypothetical protein